jgi:TPR repeat protein
MPTETVASTPSPIAPAQAPATAPTERDIQSPTERDIQIQALLSRGDAFFSAGDVTSARLFYQRGADAGDGTAALRLGETFDAAFLERAHLGRVPSDLEKAISWYRRARDLGNAEAEILLEELARQLMK